MAGNLCFSLWFNGKIWYHTIQNLNEWLFRYIRVPDFWKFWNFGLNWFAPKNTFMVFGCTECEPKIQNVQHSVQTYGDPGTSNKPFIHTLNSVISYLSIVFSYEPNDLNRAWLLYNWKEKLIFLEFFSKDLQIIKIVVNSTYLASVVLKISHWWL